MPKSILILDDDVTFAETLGRSFSRRGLTSFVTHSIAEAERIIEAEAPDYAVVDLKIDQESGLRFLPILVDKSPITKSIILTGYSSISTTVEAMKLGTVNYLCKPVNTDEILAAFDDSEAVSETPIIDNPPSVHRLEWEHIQRVLTQYDGNITATAKALGMHRRTLQRKLQKRPVSK